jgi:hypothetical protein
LLGIGQRLHPEFDVVFLSTPDKVSAMPTPQELKNSWAEVNERVRAGFTTLSAFDWLQKHTSVSDEDFTKDPLRNRFAILLSRTNHLSYHLGQTVLGSN